MTTFKVNDRVRVYATIHMHPLASKGTVLEVGDVWLKVKMDKVITMKRIYAHKMQCRKLRPKKKPVRIEGIVKWRMINRSAFPAGGDGATLDNSHFADLIGKRTRITVEVVE